MAKPDLGQCIFLEGLERCSRPICSLASFGACGKHFEHIPLVPGPVLTKLADLLATAVNALSALGIVYSLGDETLESALGWGGFYPWTRSAVLWLPAPCLLRVFSVRKTLEAATNTAAAVRDGALVFRAPPCSDWRGDPPFLALKPAPSTVWISPCTVQRVFFGAAPRRALLCAELAHPPSGFTAWDECAKTYRSLEYGVEFSELDHYIACACPIPRGQAFGIDTVSAAPTELPSAKAKEKRERPSPPPVAPKPKPADESQAAWAHDVASVGLSLLEKDAGATALLRLRQPGWVDLDYALGSACSPRGVVLLGEAAAAIDVIRAVDAVAPLTAASERRAACYAGAVASRLFGPQTPRPVLLYVSVLLAGAHAPGAGRALLDRLASLCERAGAWLVLEAASPALVKAYLGMGLGLELLTPRPDQRFLYKRYPSRDVPLYCRDAPRSASSANKALFSDLRKAHRPVVKAETAFTEAVKVAWSESLDCSAILERLVPALRRVLLAHFAAAKLPASFFPAWANKGLKLLRQELCSTTSDPAFGERLSQDTDQWDRALAALCA